MSKITIRIDDNDKEIIKNKADLIGVDVSKFIRTCALSDDKIVVLSQGSEIVKNLIEIKNKIDSFNEDEKNVKNLATLLSYIDNIFTRFNEISEYLSDIHCAAEEE